MYISYRWVTGGLSSLWSLMVSHLLGQKDENGGGWWIEMRGTQHSLPYAWTCVNEKICIWCFIVLSLVERGYSIQGPHSQWGRGPFTTRQTIYAVTRAGDCKNCAPHPQPCRHMIKYPSRGENTIPTHMAHLLCWCRSYSRTPAALSQVNKPTSSAGNCVSGQSGRAECPHVRLPP